MGLVAQDTWGNFRFPEELEQSKNRFAFTGHFFDTETDLYYAKARYYQPALRRFITADSFLGDFDEPPSLHRYTYAHNRPTYYVDPSGNIAILKNAREYLFGIQEQLHGTATDLTEYAAGQHPWLSDRRVKTYIGRRIGEVTGGLSGLTGVAADVVGLTNLAVNAELVRDDPFAMTALGQEAHQEMSELETEVAGLGKALWNNPEIVVGTVVEAGMSTLEAAGRGDPAAYSRTISFETQLAADVLIGSKGFKSAFRIGGTTLEAFEAAAWQGIRSTAREALPSLGRIGRVGRLVEERVLPRLNPANYEFPQYRATASSFGVGQVRLPGYRGPARILSENPLQTRLDARVRMRLADPSQSVKLPEWIRAKRGLHPQARIREAGNAEGVLRDAPSFWLRFSYQMPDALSPANLRKLRRGISPVVDDVWLKHFPEHRGFLDLGRESVLEHHHILGTEWAVPLPKGLHRGKGLYGMWHGSGL